MSTFRLAARPTPRSGARRGHIAARALALLACLAATLAVPVSPAGATVPNAPSNVTATTGNGQVTLRWTAPFFTNGTITGYAVTPIAAGAAQSTVAFSGGATTQVVTGLTNGTSYTFTVAAVNASGASAASAPSAPLVVGAPGLVAFPATTPGSGQGTVHWLAPVANAAPVSGYVITPNRNGVDQAPISLASTATSQTIGGLADGSSYTFTIAARNAAGTGLAAVTAPVIVGTPVAPSASPTAVPGSGQAVVTWTTPTTANGSAITGYTVVPHAGSTTLAAQAFTGTTTTQTVTGLTNGTSYTFTVAATNGRGTGPASSASLPLMVGSPTSPRSPSARPGSGVATVSWTAPASTNGSAITGYTVVPHAGSTTLAAQAFTGTATTQTVTGLNNGTSYTFTVAATNGRGTGPASSATGAVTAGAAGTVPSTPGAPQVKPSTASASVVWTAPAANGSSITSYVITPHRGTTALAPTTVAAPATSTTVWNLTNGDSLTFTVAAVNGLGTSLASAASGAIVIGTPQAPTGAVAVVGSGQATVSWSPPFFSNGTITGYVVTPYLGTVAQPAVTFASTTRSQVITGLANGSSYTFRVAAQNASGTGPTSGASAAVVVGVPAPPAFPAVTVGDGQAAVRWLAAAANAAPITGYVLTPVLNGVAQPSVAFASTAGSQTLTGLTNAGSYTFRVAASNAYGTGLSSVTAPAIVGSPLAPAAPAGTPGDGQVTLTWSAPSVANGAAVTGYVVTPWVGTTALTAEAFTSPTPGGVVTGLTNGIRYAFTVAATNARGLGAPSSAGPAVVAGSPVAPTSVAATPGDQSAVVSWAPPATTNGSPITSFSVTPYAGTTALAAQTFAGSAATTQATVTGLANGTSYTFAVAAGNARGTGPASPAGGLTIAGAPVAPGAPTVSVDVGQAVVSWSPPVANGATVSGYVVRPFLDDRPLAARSFPADATTQTIVGLQNGRQYRFTVAALNSLGQGPDSSRSAVVVPGGVPAAPAAPSVTPADQGATVNWTPPAANGFPITSFQVTPWLSGVAQPSIAAGAGATSVSVTGLANGSAYTFTVAAQNGQGTGPGSPPSTTVIAGTPLAPDAPVATPANGSVSVTWAAPPASSVPATSYVLTATIGGVAQAPLTVPVSTTSQLFGGLVNGTSVSVAVAAANAAGVGPASDPSAPMNAGAPIASTAPTASLATGGVSVSWAAATNNGGAINGYVVTPYVGDRRQEPFTIAGSGTTTLLNWLGTGTTYRLTVAARNAYGTGPESPLSAAITTDHWFCLAAPPKTAADFRAALNHHDPHWQGADGGEPVALPDGRVLWIFGDTVYGTVQPDGSLTVSWGMAHGSILVQKGSCFDPFYSATTTKPTSLVPSGAGSAAYWPGESWVSPDGATLNIVVSHVQPIAGTSDFQGLDSGVAVFSLPDLAFQRIDTMPSPPAPATGPSWQSLLYHDTAAHLVYLYARGGFNHIVARFPDTTTDFTTTDNWEFWTGSGWSLIPADAQAMALSSGTFASLSVHRTPTGFIGVAGGLGADLNTVVAWTSPTPMGPWKAIGRLADAPSSGGASLSGGAHAVQTPGADPILVWSVSPIASGNVSGSGMGVAASPVPLL